MKRKKPKSERMWALAGGANTERPFLTCGTFITRKAAIEDFGKSIDNDWRQGWKMGRKWGYRAIKVIVRAA